MSGQISDYGDMFISGSLKSDIELFEKIFEKDSVLRIKELKARRGKSLDCAVVYIDGMTDSDQLNEAVIRPLLTLDVKCESKSVAEYIEKQLLFANDTKLMSRVSDILTSVLYGEALILTDGSSQAVVADVKGWRTRGISEPQDERVQQGPREGFEEAALLNLAMLRRKLQTPDLCCENMRVGRRTGTSVYICYLDTLASPEVVSEVKKRISEIDIDGILDSNYLTEQIRDAKGSLFKTCGSTERPDTVAARLLEGRVAIVVDGTPSVVTVPYLFSESFQADEDYYLSFWVSSAGRILRYVCFFLAISIPSVFVALTVFHSELLPTSLVTVNAQLRSGVPFSPFTECIILIFVFEILREAGVRMSQGFGHTLSIVGGLVVGQAAVEARIISTPMLITVALSGIAGLMLPRLKGAVFYLRLILLLLGAYFGLLGYISGVFLTAAHIFSLTSFGCDYTVSLNKADFQSLKDTFFRASWENMRKRPLFNKNLTRKGARKK